MMKIKTKLFILAALFSGSTSYGQHYASKQNAVNGISTTPSQVAVQGTSSKASIFTDDFNGGIGAWTTVDSDGDNNEWAASAAQGVGGSGCAQSESWNGAALTPDNWLISPAIDLSTAGASTILDFWRKAQDQTWPAEKYTVYLSTSGNTVADFTGANGSVIQAQETVIADDWQKRSVSLAAHVGGTVYIAFRHHDCSDMFRLNIDDVDIYESSVIDGGITAFLAPNNNACAKTANEDVTVTIFNFGGAALTNFDVSYSINGGTPVTETVTASIPAASSIDYTFTQQADLSALGYYDFDCSVSIASDADAGNDDWSVKHIAHGDDFMTIDVSTDSQGGQAWYVTNTVSGDTIAQHGPYQWNLVNDITTVCLNNADCYNFSWVGGTSNDVELVQGGNVVDSRTATGDYQVFNFGNGCAADGADFTSITTANVVAVGNNNIEGTVMNIGTANLTSFDVVYSIDGGASSAVFTATCNVTTGNSYTFTHNVPWNTVSTGVYNVEVTVDNVNGNGVSAGTLDKDIDVLGVIFPKTVVYEEGTGTWCQFCPRGAVGLNTMANTHSGDDTWIGIGVHNADPMAVTAYDSEISAMIGGYPSGLMDRFSTEVDPGLTSLEAAYDVHVAMNPVAKIEITGQTWNAGSRSFTVDVATTFAMDMTGADYNTALIVIENGVTGGAGYEQVNVYDGGGFGPLTDYDGFDYTTAGNPVPAANMVHNHVARQLVDGFDGSAGSVPSNVLFNTANPFNYTGTIPAAHDENETEFVALVIDNATGQIVNATHAALDITVGLNTFNNSSFNMYPNPTTGLIQVEGVQGANVIVYDILGTVVYNQANASAKTTIDLSNLDAGNYFVKITNNNEVSTQKIVLTK
jgi:hypothetical protein